MKGFKNVKAYIHGVGVITTDIKVENYKITGIGTFNIDEPFYVAPNSIVLPGFIDQHIHGAGGADTMDGTGSAIQTMSNTLVKEGTTAFVPTTMTQSREKILNAISGISAFSFSNPLTGATHLGVHLEGPFISAKFKGAQPEDYIVKPSIAVFDEYYEKSFGTVKQVSLAPELDDNCNLIRYLHNLDVVASLGHSNAKYEDIEKAVKSGLTCVTHTYNAQTPLHHRDVGAVGSALLFDELYTEMICDLIHLSAPAIRLLIKNKPHDKIIAITDSMRAKGLPDGISELGGQKVIVKDGTARLEDGTLAGSILKMNDAIKNLVKVVGVPFTDAIDFATINPATNLKVDDEIGSIAVGKYADFCVLDEDFNVESTIVRGKLVYTKQS